MSNAINPIDSLIECGFLHSGKIKTGAFFLIHENEHIEEVSEIGGRTQIIKNFTYTCSFNCKIGKKDFCIEAPVNGGGQIDKNSILIMIDKLNDIITEIFHDKLLDKLQDKQNKKEKVKKI